MLGRSSRRFVQIASLHSLQAHRRTTRQVFIRDVRFCSSSNSSSTSSSTTSNSDSSSTTTTANTDSSNSNSNNSTMVNVDVTKSNFSDVLPAVKQALERCAFFAIDCEMTGLHTDGSKHEYFDDMQTRYLKISDSSKSYIITQYGLSCFELTGPNTYEASTFNFFVFPQPHGTYCRRFMCDASSLAFLSDHGFDFNTCIGQGVPYMPLRTRDWQLMQVDRASESREPVAASSEEDKAFVQELTALVKDWLAGRPIQDSALHLHGGLTMDEDILSGDESQPPAAAAAAAAANGGAPAANGAQEQLLLAPLNSWRRLLAFQELRKPQFGVAGHPGFWVTKAEGDSRCLVLVRASAQQAEAYEAQARAARVAQINAAAGFAAVFEAMRASNKPCVGHNCMFDISYGLYSFGDSFFPATWGDYKKMVRSWHRGGIWDTKYLAKRLPQVFEDTSLSSVYAATTQPSPEQLAAMQPLLEAASDATGTAVQLPSITHAPGFDKYKGLAPGEAAHEAGYDAFMTGAAFAAMLPLVAGQTAADPTHELAAALREAQERAAAAAAAATNGNLAGTSPSPYNSLPKGLAGQQAQQAPAAQQQQQQQQERLPSSNGDTTQQQQQQQPQPQQQQQQQQQNPQDLLSYVSGAVGRLNLTYSDVPFAALWGDDPIPDRPGTFCLSGLQQGYRLDDVWRLMRKQGLGTPRITPVDSASCLVTFQPEVAAAAPAAVAELGMGLLLTPWGEYARMRYTQQVPDDGANGTPAAAANAAGAAAAAGGSGGAAKAGAGKSSGGRSRAAKRPRTEAAIEQQDGGQQQDTTQQRTCRIM